jgi:hypothetical protein
MEYFATKVFSFFFLIIYDEDGAPKKEAETKFDLASTRYLIRL